MTMLVFFNGKPGHWGPTQPGKWKIPCFFKQFILPEKHYKGMLQKKRRSNLDFWLNLVWGPPAPQTWALLLGDFFIVLFKSIPFKTWNILFENCGPPTIYPGKYVLYFQILYWFWYKEMSGLGEREGVL